MNPLVTIITVNYRQAAITCELLDSLREFAYAPVEILLVDNGLETDETVRFQSRLPTVKVILSKENLGFAGGNNLAIQQAKGDYILLLNNDTLVPPGLLEPLVNLLAAEPAVGIVSPKIYYYDQPQMLQYAGTARIDFRTGRGADAARQQLDQGQFDQERATDFAHGACMLVRRQVFETIGLLTEDYFMYYEELDFSLRARQRDWEIKFSPATFIHHRESSSVGRFSSLKTYFMFRNRWLFIRRFGTKKEYRLFLTYFLTVGLPLNCLRFMLQGQWQHVQALWAGMRWNVKKGSLPGFVPARLFMTKEAS